MPGNCQSFQKKRNDRKQRTDRPPVGGLQRPADLIGENRLLKELTKRLVERALEAEMAEHLGHGKSRKTLKGEFGELPIEITSIIGNRPNCRPIAERSNIAFHEIDMDGDKRVEGFAQIRRLIEQEDVELIVLARFMQILPNDFCSDFAGRIINIHHSFLPAFIGATCHYVTTELDGGPIIEQEVKRVQHFHKPKDLMRLGRDCERDALARGIRLHVNDRTIIHQNRAIVFPD